MVHNVPCQAENKWLNGKEDEISPRLWRSAWADSLKHPRKGSHYWRYLILSLLLIFFPSTWHGNIYLSLSFDIRLLFKIVFLSIFFWQYAWLWSYLGKKNIKCKFLLKLFIRLRYEDKFKTYFWKFGARFETWSSGSILLFF